MFLDTSKDLEFRAATPREIDAETHLAHLIYGKRVLKPEAQRLRRQLVEINPESTWYLYDRDMLAASINIVPVTHEAIEEFKQGVRGWLFVGSGQVKQFAPGEPLEVIVIDLMTTPTVPPEKRNFYAQAILRDLATTTLRQWGARGVHMASLINFTLNSSRSAISIFSGLMRIAKSVKNSCYQTLCHDPEYCYQTGPSTVDLFGNSMARIGKVFGNSPCRCLVTESEMHLAA